MLRASLIAVVGSVMLVGGLVAPGSANAAPTDPAAQASVDPRGARGVTCSGGSAAQRARVQAAFRRAVANDRSPTTLRLFLHDGRTGVRCGFHENSQLFTRSVVKVALSASLLRLRQKQGRRASAAEYRLMNAAITRSVNAAGQAIYDRLGGMGPLRSLFRGFGVNGVMYTNNGRWGNTGLSAGQHVQFLRALADGSNRGLRAADKAYLIERMHHLINKQVWGVGIGVPPGTYFAIKGGWGPSASQPGYIVNSIGVVRPRSGGQYELAILTNRNPSEAAGKRRLNRSAKVINTAL